MEIKDIIILWNLDVKRIAKKLGISENGAIELLEWIALPLQKQYHKKITNSILAEKNKT